MLVDRGSINGTEAELDIWSKRQP